MISKKPVINATERTGRCRIEAEAKIIGDDIMVSVWGGTKPHIGSVAIAVPRPSIKNQDRHSATSSVINFVGHKDEAVAKMFSEKIAAACQRNCIATAGIHIDHATKKELKMILSGCEKLCDDLLKKLKKVI